MIRRSFTYKLAVLGCSAILLSGCNTFQRLAELGSTPNLAPIENPQKEIGMVTMPMPAAIVAERQPNSLWQPGARAFFRDQRARRIGDILTVVININDTAKLTNQTTRSRDNNENAKVPRLAGYETDFKKFLPDEVVPSDLLDLTSTSKVDGKGSIDRKDTISTRVAATITQVLPNGNLVIQGKQQTVVNFEMREMQVSGVIRPEDVSSENTVNYDQIAEARIAYGGRGELHDVQQARLGQQLVDILSPF